MNEEYDEESMFCVDCTEDHGLKSKIRLHGTKGLCSVCKKEAKSAIHFEELSSWVEGIWREWFHLGESRPMFCDDSDKIYYDQRGDEPELLLGELVQCSADEEGVVSALIGLMSRGDHYEIMQGGDPLIDDCQHYQRRGIDLRELEFRWGDFVKDFKHHTRYFNEHAKEFFRKLFENLRDVHSTGQDINSPAQLFDRLDPAKPVLRECAPGTLAVFRARKAGNFKTQSDIINSPEKELGNPPDHLASEGRMNPKGISYFYGAEERETCIAELRPSISEKVISGEFELVHTVRLLDLTLLSQSRHKHVESIFDDDYSEKLIHRQLLRRLHSLIAQPVLDGDEIEYLPTQAMAEYLARCMKPRVDGIIFNSVQRENGRNVVLFPHVLGGENHSANDLDVGDSVVCLKPGTLRLHEVTKIEHRSDEKKLVKGKPELIHDEYAYDEDWGEF